MPLLALEVVDVVYLASSVRISAAIGLGSGTLALLYAVRLVTGGVVSLAVGSLAHLPSAVRWRAVVGATVAWSCGAVLLAFAGSASSVLLGVVVVGAGTAVARALHPNLLVASTAGGSQLLGRAVLHHTVRFASVALAGALLGGLTVMSDLSWRIVFVVASLLALLATAAAHQGAPRDRLPDTELAVVPAEGDTLLLGVFESTNRLWQIASVRLMVVASGLIAAMTLPFVSFVPRLLSEGRYLSPGTVAGYLGVVGAAGVAGAVTADRWVPNVTEPDALLRRSVWLLGGSCTCWLVGVSLPPVGLFLLLAVSIAALAAATVLLTTALLCVVHPSLRAAATAVQGLAFATGSILGLFGYGGLGADPPSGTGPGAVIAVSVVVVVRRAIRRVSADAEALDRQVEEETQLHHSRAVDRPLLACRGIDFAYGQQQVLFDVDFTIREGEMAALLGTNGAGKSTLLRAISGLGYPSAGSIRLRGSDITYVGAERRARLGIVQVLGGRAVFGPLSVVQNLRLFSYSLGRNRAKVEAGLDRTWEMFPRLYELRNQPAATMSGGQQQMLALSRAFILEPQLLLIDELSLGLAPKVVGELLDAVRRINEAGTAVVLVEQSVNIALSVVDHAYFMEKGEIRFDGAASDLLDRSDLLRSVFLGGAAAGGATGVASLTGSAT